MKVIRGKEKKKKKGGGKTKQEVRVPCDRDMQIFEGSDWGVEEKQCMQGIRACGGDKRNS